MLVLNNIHVSEDGTKRWFKNGLCHREDGPAIEWADGEKDWCYKDLFVGEGDKPDPKLWERVTSGPLNGCIVDFNGDKYWFKDDQYHREDGPAIEFADETQFWYLNGEYLGSGTTGFWNLWDRLTDEQRGNPTLLRYLPR